MAGRRLFMRHVKEILRLKHVGRSHREIARSVGLSLGCIGETLRRAREAELDWERVATLDEGDLEQRLYRCRHARRIGRPLPDPAYVHTELRRKGVTLQLLHLEYLADHPERGYGYTQFCDIYKRWLARQRPTMRQVHRAGEKTFIDYAGHKPTIVDPETGELVEVELFVAALGASSFTYAEATYTQQLPDWTASHVHAVSFFGGVTELWVPDQLRSGVSQPCRYEPEINRTYAELAAHYGAVVLPARPAMPRDKAKAEVAVQVAERWILARLRNEMFIGLAPLNARIAELRAVLNDRRMRTYGASRRELFERFDRPALRALPAVPFVYGTWAVSKVSIDYHIDGGGHFYSVPHALVGEAVDVRTSAATVEIFFRGRRVASHARSHRRGFHTTVPEHMPALHRAHAEWSPSRFIRWGEKVGPAVCGLVSAILADRPHPEQGYRSCLGILRLEKRYGADRLNAACARALGVGARSYKHVDAILKNGLDRLPEESSTPVVRLPIHHENVRGSDYYTREGKT